jgi:DNA-binding transcriptional regulator YhcF (GntR family)
MKKGFIKVPRTITDMDFYFSERFDKTHAWFDLLQLANYKPSSFFVRGNEIKIGRGQLGYSMRTLAKRWKWNRRTVEEFLSSLSNVGLLHHRKTAQTTIITIRNYDEHITTAPQSAPQSAHIRSKEAVKDQILNDKKESVQSFSPRLSATQAYLLRQKKSEVSNA